MVNARAFSAPGKALLVGGYLVLDPRYSSYVVALSSRMHAIVTEVKSSDPEGIKITVRSSQFNGDEWNYEVKGEKGSQNFKLSEVNDKKNPFVEKTLLNIFTYFQISLSETSNIMIDIYSDAGYHSQANSVVKKNYHKEFRYHTKSITEVPKTGLGSSAGLVTVLTTALVSFFKPNISVAKVADLNLIHNLAQVSHCQAQGKVGSGFDVAAATFGSILYRRFDPDLINKLPPINSTEYQGSLVNLIDETDWKITAEPIGLPKGLRLVMGDVSSGSETTKLVAKVKEWFNNNTPRSEEIYDAINEGNLRFIDGINELSKLLEQSPDKYEAMIQSLEKGGDPKSYECFKNIMDAVDQIRENFRIITLESGADIEPPVQSKLIDDSLKLRGVLTGVVPGAGGYDAISLIATEHANLPSQTEKDSNFKNVTWLNLRQENTGLAEELPSHYYNLE